MSHSAEKPKGHTIRLTTLMLSGALIGAASTPGVGNRLDFWWYAAPFAEALSGVIIGLSIEVLFAAY